jgi:hypothetical protein
MMSTTLKGLVFSLKPYQLFMLCKVVACFSPNCAIDRFTVSVNSDSASSSRPRFRYMNPKLFMAGGPAQMELLDYKPKLQELHNQELPESVRMGQRITTMTSGQKSFPVVRPIFKFSRQGQCGTWISELLPHIGSIADDLADAQRTSPKGRGLPNRPGRRAAVRTCRGTRGTLDGTSAYRGYTKPAPAHSIKSDAAGASPAA